MERRRKHLDSLFQIALVLLGILSAAEFQYFLTTEEEKFYAYALKVFTVPFVVLIVFWLIRELFGDMLRSDIKMLFTEFCWDFWSFTLFYYLLAIFGFTVGIWSSFALSLLFILSIQWAYGRASPVEWGDRSMHNYFRSPRWIVLRTLVFMGTYILLVLIVMP